LIREPNIPEGAETVTLDVTMEVYLRDRADPLNVVGTFYFQREHLDDDDLVESFMGIVSNTIRSAIFDRSQPLIILSNELGNKFFVELSEVQAISALAPSANTIGDAIEREDG
jgi:hypothetical protein